MLIALLISGASAIAKEIEPLKVIAPDLVIESAEQGQFLDDPADPRHFKPTNIVGENCGLFGWRMKVRTTKKVVLIQEKGAEKGQPNALPLHGEPKYGYLFAAREIVRGVSPGKYSMTVCVENVPVKTFTYIVR
jgi:hypothetical protein